MELLYFCKKINLPLKAVDLLKSVHCGTEEYQQTKKIFTKNRTDFFEEIWKKNNSEALFLYFYCRFACDAHDLYTEQNISEEIYWTTFKDITVWCSHCFVESGHYGITQYDWLWRHVELKLFSLGRLQYEPITAEMDLQADDFLIKKGSKLLNVHIPEGEPLNDAACEHSIQQAIAFFRDTQYFICHSWLLYPGLKELLPEESNIIKFQNRFQVIQTDYETREAEERIFLHLEEDPEKYPVKTGLQEKAKEYLLSNKKMGSGIGLFQR